MKLHRPYIPLKVRVQVVKRMLRSSGRTAEALVIDNVCRTLSDRIAWGLSAMGLSGAELDHNPALALRRRRGTGKDTVYSPAANNPNFLEYRLDDGHLEKTTGRKPGAERTVTSKGSDRWLIAKFNRLEGRTKKRPRTKWPKGRKLRSKPFPKRASRLGHSDR